MRSFLLPAAIIFFLGIASSASLADQRQVLLEAKAALKEGRAAAAYELLAPLEAALAGQAEYDYLLGIAALDAQHPEVAVFALERAATILPGEAYIHADLARAHAALGEIDAARQEISLAQQSRPPPAVAALLEQYLDGLGHPGNASGTTATGYLEFGAGFDSNANSATSDRSMAIPAFGGYAFSLADSSVKTGSPFHQENAVLAVQHALSETTVAQLRLAGAMRYYSRESRLDSYNLDVAAGLSHHLGAHQFSLAVQAATLGVDGSDYRRTQGLFGQWQYRAAPHAQVGAFIQEGDISYPTAPLRQARRLVAGVFASRILDVPASSLAYASFYAGRERPTQTDYPFLGHDVYGLRLGTQITINERWSAILGLGFEQRNYGGDDPLFLTPRRDRQSDALAGLIYAIDHSWSIRAMLSSIDNAANLPLNRFTRNEAQLSLRKEF